MQKLKSIDQKNKVGIMYAIKEWGSSSSHIS